MKPTTKDVDAARHLLRAEEGESLAAAVERAHGAIVGALSPVIGAAGVRALFARSVKRCAVEHPSLLLVPDEEPGPGFARAIAEARPSDASRMMLAVFAMFLALISNFIGQELVWRILGSAFPALATAQSKEFEP